MSLLGGQQAAAPEPEAAETSGEGLDLSALLGGAASTPAPAEDDGLSADTEKQMLSKLLSKL